MSSILKLFNGFSYKEKSILISLGAVSVIYGGYFYDLMTGRAEQTMPAMLNTMAGIVVALVVVHVIFHIVISLDDVEEAEDERDKAVARRASVFAYNILFVAVLMITGRIVVLGAWADGDPLVALPDTYQIANLLLAGLVISEVVYYLAQLIYYRRGVPG